MDKKLIQEINKIKRLSNLNESVINEGLIDDITHFFKIASDEIKKTEIVQKLRDYFKSIIPDLFDETSTEESDTKGNIKLNTSSDDDDVYKEILNSIGAPITDENMLFMYAWRQSEHTKARNNPFATTQGGFNSTPFGNNPDGVKNYPTREDGLKATVKTLKNGYYNCIIDGLKNDIGAKNISKKCNDDLDTWGTHKTDPLITQVLTGWEKNGVSKPPSINTTYDA